MAQRLVIGPDGPQYIDLTEDEVQAKEAERAAEQLRLRQDPFNIRKKLNRLFIALYAKYKNSNVLTDDQVDAIIDLEIKVSRYAELGDVRRMKRLISGAKATLPSEVGTDINSLLEVFPA